MASSSVIELDALLAPISDDAPTGEDIREDASPTSAYYTIKDARNAARAAERNGLFDESADGAAEHWRQVLDHGPEILKGSAKDLEIATWMVEALTRRHGFSGLRDGIALVEQLVDQYWEALYPMPDEDGMETRVAPLTGLNGEGAEGVLVAPIRNIPITEGQTIGPFTFWQYQQALDVQKLTDEDARAQRAAALGFGLTDIEKATSETPPAFFVTLRDDIESALANYRSLSAKLDERCGAHDAPPTSNIINVLDDVLGAINHLARDKFPVSEIEEEGADEETDTPEGDGGTTESAAARKAKTREEAFRQLVEISDYFRQTEPHSPLSYMLDKAVRWGRMPLHELIAELIPDSSSRDYYESLTGVRVEEESG